MAKDSKYSRASAMWPILLILIFAVILGLSVYTLAHQSKKSGDQSPIAPTRYVKLSPTAADASPSATLTPQEKESIDSWIEENNLNKYGDPMDTNYAGGTPLFDETTGESIDKYEYILQNHTDRPWNN